MWGCRLRFEQPQVTKSTPSFLLLPQWIVARVPYRSRLLKQVPVVAHAFTSVFKQEKRPAGPVLAGLGLALASNVFLAAASHVLNALPWSQCALQIHQQKSPCQGPYGQQRLSIALIWCPTVMRITLFFAGLRKILT